MLPFLMTLLPTLSYILPSRAALGLKLRFNTLKRAGGEWRAVGAFPKSMLPEFPKSLEPIFIGRSKRAPRFSQSSYALLATHSRCSSNIGVSPVCNRPAIHRRHGQNRKLNRLKSASGIPKEAVTDRLEHFENAVLPNCSAVGRPVSTRRHRIR